MLKSKAILEEYEIDWLKGKENLVRAPNIEGLHTEEMTKMVYEKLKMADDAKGTKKAVVKTLKKLGEMASEHTRGKTNTWRICS